MSEVTRPKPKTYYVRAELEEGGISTLIMRTAREALASASSFKAQGLKVKVTQDGGALISEAKLQARAAREGAN